MACVSQIAVEPNPSSSILSPATTMSDEGVTCGLDTGSYRPFQLFLLPVEIQLQIYRFAWMTGPLEIRTIRGRLKYSDAAPLTHMNRMRIEIFQREISKKLKEQLSTVCIMGAVCRHMREVVYAEYFSRTQAVLQSNIGPPERVNSLTSSAVNNDVRQVVEKSVFVREHVRHACIVINDLYCTTPGSLRLFHWKHAKDDKLMSTFRWLLNLQKLKTLEVVFEQRQDLASRSGLFWEKGHQGLESAKPVIRSLPRLEKLVLRLEWCHPHSQEEAISWEEVPWFQEFRQAFLENTIVSEDAEQRCFKFTNHIGLTYPDWPCSYKI
ncbi:hypothetical protein QBC32DRAFT_253087 [Pseudoneurospora amorphoporcata]|uniref:Uncharacterized protein n=1 Tax=Pseudoneurospora amorphoporcata TaxID=241081 RepID=A0AAN6P0E2_9PEZI|nr:hypothetical protein QBC32DRAFT_253087 [Pseudoneurospora amorphoporcata]